MTYLELLEKVGDGKIFSAGFTKKDGSFRVMNCRRGVVKHLKGGVLKYNPQEKQLIPVYDMHSKGYRSIPFDRLKWIQVDGKTIRFE
jgi:hypothetical protein